MSDTYDAAVAAIDPGSISAMSREEAGQALDRLTDAYKGVIPLSTVSKVDPTNGVEAATKLAHLQRDADWRAMFENGHVGARQEFDKLTKMIAETPDAEFAKAGVVPAGHVNTGPGASLQDQIAAVRDMIAQGWAPSAIDDVIGDRKPTLQEHVDGKLMLARFMSNPALTGALQAGNIDAQRLHRDLCWAVGCYDGT
jgi:hypothetical protein